MVDFVVLLVEGFFVVEEVVLAVVDNVVLVDFLVVAVVVLFCVVRTVVDVVDGVVVLCVVRGVVLCVVVFCVVVLVVDSDAGSIASFSTSPSGVTTSISVKTLLGLKV